MKLSIPLLTFLLVGLFSSPKSAQSQIIPQAGLLTEFTYSGILIGGFAGVDFGKRLSAGAFYEVRTDEFDTELNEDLSAYGGYFGYSILQEEKLSLGVLLRTGISSNKFVFFAPAVTFGYRINQRFNVSAMMGLRYQRYSSAITFGYNFIKSEK